MADDPHTRLHTLPLAIRGLLSEQRTLGSWWAAARSHRGWTVASLVLLSGTCLLGLGWLRAPASDADTRYAAPPAWAAQAELSLPTPAPLRFADGSTVALHGAASTVHTEELSAERVRLRLSGGARFEVVPNQARSFAVSNAQVLVRRVLGTVFSIDPEGVRTRVTVERGRVQVMWRSGAALLSAGEAATFPPENEPAFAPPQITHPRKLR